MSELLLQQMDFAERMAEFILWIKAQGCRSTFGEAWRSDEEAALQAAKGAGIVNSLHRLRLAVDLNIFRGDGRQVITRVDFLPFGEHWKTLDPRCCWGGDFRRVDADHFSMAWQGIK